jgi:hypothetical protein
MHFNAINLPALVITSSPSTRAQPHPQVIRWGSNDAVVGFNELGPSGHFIVIVIQQIKMESNASRLPDGWFLSNDNGPV